MRLLDRMRSRALPDPETAIAMATTWSGMSGAELVAPTYESYATAAVMSNATVYALVQARMQLFAQAELKFQVLSTQRVFGTTALSLLERPWPNGTSSDLLARMELHNSVAGNAFVRRLPDRLEVLRPDWVEIVRALVRTPDGAIFEDVLGYMYYEGGMAGSVEPVMLPVDEVAHWSPMPDPVARWRGMSWLTPVLREINADASMTQHKQRFFEQAATPNMMIRYQQKLTQDAFDAVKARWQARYAGPNNAGGTVILDNGADLTVVGQSFEQMQFATTQAAGETRIAQAAGVPPVVAGLQSGLDASTYSNYAQAMRLFAFQTEARWQSAVAALAKFVTVPPGTRLWYSTQNISAMQDAETERATAAKTFAEAASTFITAGYEPQTVVDALLAGDMGLLKHTGLVSVQLQTPGSEPGQPDMPDPAEPDADDTEDNDEDDVEDDGSTP